MDRYKNRWIDISRDGQIQEEMDRYKNIWIDKRMHRLIDRRIDAKRMDR